MVRVVVVGTVRKDQVRLKLPNQFDNLLTGGKVGFQPPIRACHHLILDVGNLRYPARLLIPSLRQWAATHLMMPRFAVGRGDELDDMPLRPIERGKPARLKLAVIGMRPNHQRANLSLFHSSTSLSRLWNSRSFVLLFCQRT